MSPKMLEEAFEGAQAMYNSGDISKEEYLNILKGFDVERVVASGAEDYEKKQQLNQMINAAITVVSAVA
jgi:hypothetical protein